MTGRVMSEAELAADRARQRQARQVKSANVLLKFDKPAPAALMASAQMLAEQIELDLAWEFAPEEEFGFADLAADYFQDPATTEQQVAALLRLSEAPHYFRRAGKGRYKKAPAEILQQALAAIEKKKALQAQIDAWTAELVAGSCPQPVRDQLYKILFKPDKNAPEYKAVAHAAPDPPAAAGAAAEGRRDQQRLPVPLAALPVRAFPARHGLPGAAGSAIADELPLSSRAGVLDRRLEHDRDRRRALSAGHRQRDGAGRHPHRGAGTGDPARRRDRQVAQPPVHRLHAGAQDHHAARRGGADLHARVGRQPAGAVALPRLRRGRADRQEASETKLELVPIAHNLRHDQLDRAITAEWH